MKKTLLSLAFSALFLCIISSSFAQFSLACTAGAVRHLGLGNGIISLGLRGEYSFSDNISFMGTANYFLPMSRETEVMLESSNMYEYTYHPAEEKLSAVNLTLEMKYFGLGAEAEDDFAPYLIAGGGLSIYTSHVVYEDNYDKTKYHVSGAFSPKAYYMGLAVNLGIGADINVGRNVAFMELRGMIPASLTGDGDITSDLPFGFMANVGFRIPLN